MWKLIIVVLYTKINKMILNLRNGREFWNDVLVYYGSNFIIYGLVNLLLLSVLWYLSDYVFKFFKNVLVLCIG